MINSIYWGCITVFVIIYTFYNINKITIIKKYSSEEILKLFDYFLDKSYQSVYESDIITFIVNSVKPSNEELETIERNFIKSSLLYMGKYNRKLFLQFYGDEQTMFINMIRFVRRKINEDGLTKIINQFNLNQTESNQQNG